MAGLIIFTEVALAGCVFLIYFLYALWRDSRNCRKGARVEIRPLPRGRREKGKLLRLHSVEELRKKKQRI